jgi:serine/threonine-protein kinase
MPLEIGSRLGHYDVTALIGEGGMGQVYQATDTKLNRQVALKILPEAFASDPDRLARFQREAQVLASLNHPNIAAIHGLEEGDGTRALVLELVEGPTLADRIAQGPIPLEAAVAIAKQIAEALEAAHDAGVVHRDLKPANVKVKDDGTVKVLDFGLAKALEGDTGSDPSESPTLTAAATQMGVILGTAAYMSPEQAAGENADKRSDIWSFGVVLFEMLTGQRLFTGKTVSHVLGAVLQVDPKWDVLPAPTPQPLRKLLRRCLEKERKRRLRDIGDTLTELDDALTEQPIEQTVAAAPVVQLAAWRHALPWALGLAVVAAFIAGFVGWSLRAPPLGSPERFVISSSPSAAPDQPSGGTELAISPNGRLIAYAATVDGESGLYIRPVDSLEGRLLPGTEGAVGMFFSPDGTEVAFGTGVDNSLKKIRVSGGPATTLCALTNFWRGGSWGPDGTIVFAMLGSGLFRVSAAGGEPEMLTEPEAPNVDHWPDVLPNGRAVLFATGSNLENVQIAVLVLETGNQHVLPLSGTHPRYLSSGHILYSSGSTLMAVAFDADQLEVVGDPIPVLEGVPQAGTGAVNVAVSSDGALVYRVGESEVGARRTLVWVDRQGTEEAVAADPLPYEGLAISPDGLRVATEVLDPNNEDIWVFDLVRETPTRFTLAPGRDLDPVWTPDGERLMWSSIRDGLFNGFWKAADGTGEVERLTSHEDPQGISSITPDGKTVLIWQTRGAASGVVDVGIMSLDDPETTDWLFENPFRFGQSQFSPDGRMIAYTSDEEGQDEVYVRPFPNVEDGREKVSQDGGFAPQWGPNSDELFYQAYQDTDRESGTVTLMMAPIETEPRLRPGNPVALFSGPYRAGEFVLNIPGPFAVSPDGQRFLIIKEPTGTDEAAANDIILVQHFDEELKRLFPDQ